jgi:hypothetical protein
MPVLKVLRSKLGILIIKNEASDGKTAKEWAETEAIRALFK